MTETTMVQDNHHNQGNLKSDVASCSYTIPLEKKSDDSSYATLIPDKLYLGNFSHAFDPVLLNESKFTHILNVSGWGGMCCERRWEAMFGNPKPVWKVVKIRDLPRVDIRCHFEDCFAFLDDALQLGPETKVLLH